MICSISLPGAIILDQWRLLYSVNPMVGVIDGFRWTLFGQDINLYLPGFILSLLVAITLFVSGVWFFQQTERSLASLILKILKRCKWG